MAGMKKATTCATVALCCSQICTTRNISSHNPQHKVVQSRGQAESAVEFQLPSHETAPSVCLPVGGLGGTSHHSCGGSWVLWG